MARGQQTGVGSGGPQRPEWGERVFIRRYGKISEHLKRRTGCHYYI